MTAPLHIGVAACFFHPDPERNIFKGKTLLYAEESMLHYLMRHGALPLMLPSSHAGFDAAAIVANIDGLLLQGGSDVSPLSYGEQPLDEAWAGDRVHDLYETELIRAALAAGKPVLGICRGHQILNVALGGSLYQDIGTQLQEAIIHRNADIYDQLRHEVTIDPRSRLGDLYRKYYGRDVTRGTVNSVHHQAVKDLAPGFVIEARSAEDGVIEAIRLTQPDAAHLPENARDAADPPYAAGVQWHPEFQYAGRDDALLSPEPMLTEFLHEALRRRRLQNEKSLAENGRSH